MPLRIVSAFAVIFLTIKVCVASDAICPPTGIYCSCPPTNAFSHSVLPSVAALPFVDGTLVRVTWADIEPTPGNYDWTILDDELQFAADENTLVALGVVCGALGEPSWLYEPLGSEPAAEPFEFFFRCDPEAEPCEVQNMPLPWDGRFLSEWSELIAALGERYDGHPQISLVHMTSSTANGFEMQIPFSPPDTQNWMAIGYDAALHAQSWRTVIDAFAAAFPTTPLDVDVHPVLGADAVATDVVAYAASTIGSRFGVFSAWWTQNNADNTYPGMYALLLDSADAGFATVQFARSEVRHGAASFGSGGVAGAMQRVLDDQIGYAEVWNADLLAGTFDTSFASAAMALRVDAGDMNRDGSIDLSDVSLFVDLALALEPVAGVAACASDINGDGCVNGADIQGFTMLLVN